MILKEFFLEVLIQQLLMPIFMPTDPGGAAHGSGGGSLPGARRHFWRFMMYKHWC